MTSPGIRHSLGWAPVIVVGVVSAVAAEVAIALLLYSGPGFTRSLTTLLTVEALALAAGLAFPVPAVEVVDGLRRRWLLALGSFLVATVFGTLWTIFPDLGSGRAGQGLGLAVLAGLPLYACGALLGGLAREGMEDGWPPGGPPVASPAAVGAAVGFALTGLLLPRAPTPSSLLVGCLALLSLGGMAYGAVRSGRPRRRVIAEGCVGPPPVRVEERFPAGVPWTDWVLLEGGVVRALRRFRRDEPAPSDGGSASDGSAASQRPVDEPWELRMVRELAPRDRPWRGLFVGGGASLAPMAALREHGAAEVGVLERAHCVVDLGRSHFHSGLAAQDDVLPEPAPGAAAPPAPGPPVVVGNLGDGIRGMEGPYDLVVVDGRALDPIGGAAALSSSARETLSGLVGDGGAIVWGPTAAHHPRDPSGPEWTTERRDRPDPLEEVLVARRGAAAEPVTTTAEGGPTTS